MWWQLAVAKSAQKSQLVLRRQAADPEEKTVPDLSAAEAIVLADNIDAVSISYFDPGDDPLNNPDAGTWIDSWDENARMPSIIAIRVKEAGDRRWPDLYIPVKLSQALGCNFDYQRQRCVIQTGMNR